MKEYDVCMHCNGCVRRWYRGFFERCAFDAGVDFNESKYITIRNYRIPKSELNIEAMVKFLRREGLENEIRNVNIDK